MEIRDVLAERITDMLFMGRTDAWIREELRMTHIAYEQAKRRALKKYAEVLKERSTEEVYAEYVLKQSACIRDLTKMAISAQSERQAQALISAVKARSDIYDKMIKTGQDFGIIEKKAIRTETMVGVVIANLSDEELKKRIAGELSGLNDLMEKFGDKNLLEVKPGPLHRALPPAKKSEKAAKDSRTNRAKANRVHGGRRVVKEARNEQRAGTKTMPADVDRQ